MPAADEPSGDAATQRGTRTFGMQAAMRMQVAVVAGLLAAFTGGAGLGSSASAQPQLPRVAFGVDPNAPAQAPAPLTQIPTGETRPDPPTGWDRYAPSNLSATIEEAWGQ